MIALPQSEWWQYIFNCLYNFLGQTSALIPTQNVLLFKHFTTFIISFSELVSPENFLQTISTKSIQLERKVYFRAIDIRQSYLAPQRHRLEEYLTNIFEGDAIDVVQFLRCHIYDDAILPRIGGLTRVPIRTRVTSSYVLEASTNVLRSKHVESISTLMSCWRKASKLLSEYFGELIL